MDILLHHRPQRRRADAAHLAADLPARARHLCALLPYLRRIPGFAYRRGVRRALYRVCRPRARDALGGDQCVFKCGDRHVHLEVLRAQH